MPAHLARAVRRLRRLIFIALLLTCLPHTTSAAPDDWHVEINGDWRGYYRAAEPVVSRDFQRCLDALSLTDDQRRLAESLYAAFSSEVRDMSTIMKEKRADLQHSGETDTRKQRAAQQTITKLTENFDRRAKDMTLALFADLRLIITPEQESAWDDLEKLRRRRETLSRFAAMPAEHVDLAVIIDGMKITAESRLVLDPILADYLIELDTAINARNAKVTLMSPSARAILLLRYETWLMEDEKDIAAAEKRINSQQSKLVSDALQLRDLCKRIRDINERYTRELAARMPTDDAARFERQVRKIIDEDNEERWNDWLRAHGAIESLENLDLAKPVAELQLQFYGGQEWGDYFQQRADRLRGIPALSESQRAELALIKSDLETEYDALRQRHGRLRLRSDEPTQFEFPLDGSLLRLYRGERYLDYWERGHEEERDEDYERDKARLSQRFVDRLRAILTIEQRSYIADR